MKRNDKCKQCNLYTQCEYLKKDEVCNDNMHITTYEEEFSFIKGEPIQIEVSSNDSDIRLDLVVEKKKASKLWGQVKDLDGKYIEHAMVTLLKPQYIRGKIEYFSVGTTFSDCFGFYHFEIEKLDKGLKYMISVSK